MFPVTNFLKNQYAVTAKISTIINLLRRNAMPIGQLHNKILHGKFVGNCICIDSYLLRVRALAHAHVCPHVRVRVFVGTFQRRARPGVWAVVDTHYIIIIYKIMLYITVRGERLGLRCKSLFGVSIPSAHVYFT